MLFNAALAKEFAGLLLEIQAVKLNPEHPFTWASGWKSPIYCDNRLTLSYPHVRTFIKNNLAQCIQQNYTHVDSIAGVATAGIPHGVLVAEALNKPFIYVRSEAKKHGLTNQIEGKISAGDSVVVIEDLISTGMSSLQAVHAIRKAGGKVAGMAALFTYGFTKAEDAFADADCNCTTLTDYTTTIQYAIEKNIIPSAMQEVLLQWRKNPAAWMQ